MSNDINNSENDQEANLIVDQPHNSKRPSSINLNNIEENKRHSPFIFQNIPTFADAQQLNSAEIVSLTVPYLQHPKKSLSSTIPYNPNYPIQNINLSARNSFNPQQQLILNSLDSGKDMDKLPNPLFSSNSLNLNPPLLTGSSNFSPMDIHNPLMRNPFMIPTYNAVYDNFSGKQFASFSPLNSTTKPSSTRDDEKEFEEFKRTQSEKNNKALKKTTKKVEKKKKRSIVPIREKAQFEKVFRQQVLSSRNYWKLITTCFITTLLNRQFLKPWISTTLMLKMPIISFHHYHQQNTMRAKTQLIPTTCLHTRPLRLCTARLHQELQATTKIMIMPH